MSEENKTVELKDEELDKVNGGTYGSSGDNWTITIKFGGTATQIFGERSFPLQVTPNTTVLEVKQMIDSKEHIDPEGQMLILLGKKLEEQNTLGNSGVVNGSVINLLVKVRY